MTIFQSFSRISRLSAKWMFTPVTCYAVAAIVCLMMLGAAGVASAQTSLTTYWVAPSQADQAYSGEPVGNDSNNGLSQSTPWLTFAHAAATATTAGDTVIFMDGTYGNPNKVTGTMVDMTTSGTAAAPITFKAQHRGMAILDGGNPYPGGSTCTGASSYLDLDTASYIVIQGFVIQNTCATGVVDNNESTNVTLRWNEIYDIGNGINPGTVYGIAAFYCGGPSIGGASGVVLDGNSIHDIGRVPNATYWDNDQGLYINCPNVTIINNIFYNQDAGYDIQVAGSEGSGREGAANILIANNTFGPLDPNGVNPKHNDLYAEVVVWRGSSSGSVSGLTFQNNIFYEPLDYAIYGSYPNVSNCEIDANLITNLSNDEVYYADPNQEPGAGCTIGTKNLGPTDPTQVMSNPGSPACSYNPNLPHTCGYDLVGTSPAIGNGDTVGAVSSDYARRCRPQMGEYQTGSGYDIGAYQYHGSQTCE